MNEHVLLVAEDDEIDALLLERAVAKAGGLFRLVRVKNGDEAISYLRGETAYEDRKLHPLPDLMLIDLRMPRTDGFGVLEWLRASDLKPRLPAVVLSSSDLGEDLRRAYLLGANSYVVKPTNPDRLHLMITALYEWWVKFNITAAHARA